MSRRDASKDPETMVVVVPCYNEARNIDLTVAAILRVVPSLPVAVRILMVDDGSTDGTRERMEAICAEHPGCEILANPKNLGIGASVLRAFAHITDATWVTVVPGDNEFYFESIEAFLAVRDDYDLVLGYWQNPVVRPLTRRLASGTYTAVVSLLYGFSYRYVNGLKLMRLEYVRDLDVVARGHAFDSELLARALLRHPKIRVGEVPFVARGRTAGASKAFRPRSVALAVREVAAGFRAVSRYRREVVRSDERRWEEPEE